MTSKYFFSYDEFHTTSQNDIRPVGILPGWNCQGPCAGWHTFWLEVHWWPWWSFQGYPVEWCDVNDVNEGWRMARHWKTHWNSHGFSLHAAPGISLNFLASVPLIGYSARGERKMGSEGKGFEKHFIWVGILTQIKINSDTDSLS